MRLDVAGFLDLRRRGFSRTHAVGGAPPSRRLTAWAVGKGNYSPALLVHLSVNSLNGGKYARPPRLDGVSRRDGGGPTASFRLRLCLKRNHRWASLSPTPRITWTLATVWRFGGKASSQKRG